MVYEKNKHLDANYSQSSIVQGGGQVQLEKVGRDVTGLAKDALGVNSASGAMDKISSLCPDINLCCLESFCRSVHTPNPAAM